MPEIDESKNSRTVYTYKYLRAVSWHAFEIAKQTDIGRFHNLLTTMLFSSFCLEAFLNHVGQEKITFWDSLQRSLKTEEKLKVISSFIGFEYDKSKLPFQIFGDIFRFRNNLVHAGTIILDIDNGLQSNSESLEPLSDWEAKINMENAKRYLDNTKIMIQQIARAAGYDPETVLSLGRVKRIIHDFGPSALASS